MHHGKFTKVAGLKAFFAQNQGAVLSKISKLSE